jgi:hypothetical protein
VRHGVGRAGRILRERRVVHAEHVLRKRKLGVRRAEQILQRLLQRGLHAIAAAVRYCDVMHRLGERISRVIRGDAEPAERLDCVDVDTTFAVLKEESYGERRLRAAATRGHAPPV